MFHSGLKTLDIVSSDIIGRSLVLLIYLPFAEMWVIRVDSGRKGLASPNNLVSAVSAKLPSRY